jgi:hypothetical protein
MGHFIEPDETNAPPDPKADQEEHMVLAFLLMAVLFVVIASWLV